MSDTDAERMKAYYENDFAPALTVDDSVRVAHAMEYIAFHMGQQTKKLDELVHNVELLCSIQSGRD